MAMQLLPTEGCICLWAGKYKPARLFGLIKAQDDRIRKWTIPKNDCVAWPTMDFYHNRTLWLSNEGNEAHPRFVALDRYNDKDWDQNVYLLAECVQAVNTLTFEERFMMLEGYKFRGY